jgi:8-oxo-dGTP pyrophosphatase MutT (NUDIX family)
MIRDVTAMRERTAARLTAFGHTEIPPAPGIRRAAVVICVIESDAVPGILVIKRAYRGRNPGQWGLPGGRMEPGETVEQTALRELHEELGLDLSPSDVVGRLDDFPASSGFVISPVVAVTDVPATLTPSPDEVHSAHHVPLTALAADDVVTWTDTPSGSLLQLKLAPTMTIHAPTGAMLLQFREVVLLNNDLRVSELLQPDWTRH